MQENTQDGLLGQVLWVIQPYWTDFDQCRVY